MASTILMVEDSSDDAELLKALMRASGINNPLWCVASAGEAIAYLEGKLPFSDRTRFPLPRIVLLDLKMPGTDGFELLSWIRKRPELSAILVVVISALDDWQSIRRAYELGAQSFLPKPCKADDLAGLVRGFPAFWRSEAP